jgi:hypothetical protein
MPEMAQYALDLGPGGLAMRALIVAIFDERYGSIGWPDDMVLVLNRDAQFRTSAVSSLASTHRGYMLPASP